MGKSVALLVDVAVVLGRLAKLLARLAPRVVAIINPLGALTPELAFIENLTDRALRDRSRAAIVVRVVYFALLAQVVTPFRIAAILLIR